jgi:hypothetical protein
MKNRILTVIVLVISLIMTPAAAVSADSADSAAEHEKALCFYCDIAPCVCVPWVVRPFDDVHAPCVNCDELGCICTRPNPITDERLAELVASGRIPADITELNLNNNLITDISPLATLTNLRELDLRANQITDISPLAGLTELGKGMSVLSLGHNQISDISVLAGLPDLFGLLIENNHITDISPLAGLKQLWWVNVQNNLIEDVSPIAELPALEVLSLRLIQHGNPITEEQFERFVEDVFDGSRYREFLTVFHLHGNQRYRLGDALQVLRYLIGLTSIINECSIAKQAAMVVSEDRPQLADALQILRHIVGLESVLNDREGS